ncbi:flagellar hook-associated protein FlgK [Anoxybacillus flavithermus]|uniref:flagellar hook-associated protein FlgK n=1 Tax=Anoxybacillus flavithermus TaxID=33934 RepID=UPI000AF04784|nr:flagellar hook-associated protein FlgK [Anoxybacillus flavithermus]MBE2940843.1 flagellar hook-associated protein FlgK [Anoxybacillus flavithermus]MBE2943532.1 flagellar hook-associated protein FlgK [Anoxybacillus flavithermus]MBE2951831.1 flagellar hook-associated protein FlgK [Anoxybacillus flavithermus]MBE2954422.1 flagellar hook-associated protein FlgK [Anoxybacillus flavithermus]MBE2959856.1 flagellar hook-associated protein FlgK [Anoxybacillus flavithermus]
MRSTFHGLEVAKRGMFTQQSALYVTGHNIANANTPGYSRQRVNFVQTEPYPPASMNRPQIPGQMGTGVEAGSIERVRESFLDIQYRGENNKLGYWETRADALKKMEDIMNEPSDSGLAKTMDQFWQALQDLSVNPENEGARSVVRQRGLAVVETFHYLHDSLSQIKKDLGHEIGVTITEINSLAKQISQINQQISEVEPNGHLPNDLYDERDRLVDQLSELINVQVEKVPSGGNSLKIAEGSYNIYLVDSNGNPIKDGSGNIIYLVQGSTANSFSLTNGQDIDNDGIIETPNGDINNRDVQVGGNSIPITSATNQVIFPSGKLLGLIESFGYKDASGNVKGIYPEMINNLDNLAYTFGTVFNAVHKEGYGLNSAAKAPAFFDVTVPGAAKNIKLSSEMDDLSNIAASTKQGVSGNGNNALNLASVGKILLSSGTVNLIDVSISLPTSLPLTSGTIQSNYQGWIGKLGVDGQQAERLKNNSEVLRQSVEERRQSVSSVSLDEEMTNMIKYQHAYNAAARQITVIDEMLDKIINGMGIVGR